MGFLSGIVKSVFGGGSSEASSSTSSTQSTTINNETIVNFEGMGEGLESISQSMLTASDAQIEMYNRLVILENDGLLTDEQQLTLMKIRTDKEALELQKTTLNNQTKNNRLMLALGFVSLLFGFWQYFKSKKKSRRKK